MAEKSTFTREYKLFCERLREAREQAGLTQTDLAKKLNRHQNFVSRYETGQRRLDAIELIWVAKAIGLKASDIIAELES